MTRLKRIFFEYGHFLLLILFIFPQIWFEYLEKTMVPRYFMYSPIDRYIPFVKVFVIPYLSWYIFMGAAFVYLGFNSKKDYYRLYIMLFAGMCIACTIFTLFPNGQNLRLIITGKDIFSNIISYIYSVDTPTNVSPSIHVFNSLSVYIVLTKCNRLREEKFINLGILIYAILICLSTVFIKQHSIKDAMWGSVLVFCVYQAVYKLPGIFTYRKDIVSDFRSENF